MELELHHFLILVKPDGDIADLLVSAGLTEGTPNRHPGQGTSNRRFNFSNSMLEILWLHDTQEAINGPGKNLLFTERANSDASCPFGLVFNRKDNTDLQLPFAGWFYQPDYFEPPRGFHIGTNSVNVLEPLCIYMPFVEPDSSAKKIIPGPFGSVTEVKIYTPLKAVSDVLSIVNTADNLSIIQADQHLMEIIIDKNHLGLSRDFRPEIPLVIYW